MESFNVFILKLIGHLMFWAGVTYLIFSITKNRILLTLMFTIVLTYFSAYNISVKKIR